MVVLWIYHCTMCHQSMKRILLVQALQASQVFKVMLHYFYDLINHATCKEHVKIKVSPNSKLHYVSFISMNNFLLSCSFNRFSCRLKWQHRPNGQHWSHRSCASSLVSSLHMHACSM